MNILEGVGLLSLVNYSVTDYLLKPLKAAFPDKAPGFWWLLYVPFVTGFAITYVSGLNVFAEILPAMSPTLGLVLTAAVSGCGNNILYSLFGKKAGGTVS